MLSQQYKNTVFTVFNLIMSVENKHPHCYIYKLLSRGFISIIINKLVVVGWRMQRAAILKVFSLFNNVQLPE